MSSESFVLLALGSPNKIVERPTRVDRATTGVIDKRTNHLVRVHLVSGLGLEELHEIDAIHKVILRSIVLHPNPSNLFAPVKPG